ncbi:MAG TPA: ACT domain-containing protein [Blastocatellia bacterium]|nr:ACT domain-containing protein [Blastocatellia bacterium]
MHVTLHLTETQYTVASLPLQDFAAALDAVRGAPDFISLTRDKAEVTLIVTHDAWAGMASRFPEARAQGSWRMIFFDAVMDFSVVGFIAEISRALAKEGISILTVSTYSTDAVLVNENCYEAAVAAVKRALITFQYTHLSQH